MDKLLLDNRNIISWGSKIGQVRWPDSIKTILEGKKFYLTTARGLTFLDVDMRINGELLAWIPMTWRK